MASFSLFMDVTPSELAKIARERRNVRLSLLFRTFCHVVYATLGQSVLCVDRVISDGSLATTIIAPEKG
jgi:hypothetical protein